MSKTIKILEDLKKQIASLDVYVTDDYDAGQNAAYERVIEILDEKIESIKGIK